jgi:hypothetical protein
MKKKKIKDEAIRYIKNAEEILSKSSIEDNRYIDVKYVKSSCGIAYLGVLKAIDEYLLKIGVTEKELPKKVEEYIKSMKKYAGVHNGKLIKQFYDIYHELHIAGYYRGDLRSVGVVKSAINTAKDFIEKISEKVKKVDFGMEKNQGFPEPTYEVGRKREG